MAHRSRSRHIFALSAACLLLLLPFIALSVDAGLYEGAKCYHESAKRAGVCKLLPYCRWAVKERLSDMHPQTCSFVGFMPVVCCPYSRAHDPEYLPLRPSPALLTPGQLTATGLTPSGSNPPTDET